MFIPEKTYILAGRWGVGRRQFYGDGGGGGVGGAGRGGGAVGVGGPADTGAGNQAGKWWGTSACTWVPSPDGPEVLLCVGAGGGVGGHGRHELPHQGGGARAAVQYGRAGAAAATGLDRNSTCDTGYNRVARGQEQCQCFVAGVSLKPLLFLACVFRTEAPGCGTTCPWTPPRYWRPPPRPCSSQALPGLTGPNTLP